MEGDSVREENTENVSYHGSTTSLLHSVTHPSGIAFRTIGLMLLCLVGFGKALNFEVQQYILFN